jgi:hypothetical protein
MWRCQECTFLLRECRVEASALDRCHINKAKRVALNVNHTTRINMAGTFNSAPKNTNRNVAVSDRVAFSHVAVRVFAAMQWRKRYRPLNSSPTATAPLPSSQSHPLMATKRVSMSTHFTMSVFIVA